ncbi:MAG: PPC domain-containing protein, partial [Pirellulaceae bacterium]
MATERLKSLSALKKTRKFRDLARKESRRMHLERLEERRVMATGPTLTATIPNSGLFLNANDTLNVAPREMRFRFAEGQVIDPATVAGGFRVVRSGLDNTFGEANDVVVVPGFIGMADTPREVIMRFASNLPDDLYRIEVIGAGLTPLKDTAGLPFNGGENKNIDFTLDLGAKVMAVVPQPIARNATTGALTQNMRAIEVYFDQNEFGASVSNPAYYKLVSTTTGAIALPQNVVYDATQRKATLNFAADIPVGTFKLEVGTSEESNDRTTQAVHIGNSMTTARHAFLGDNITLPTAQQNRDIDLYRIDLRSGAAITVNLTPSALLNGAIRIFDSAGNPVGAVANSGGAGAAESLTTAVLPAGIYYVGISSSGNTAYNPVTGTGIADGNSTGAYSFQVTFNDSPLIGDANSSFGSATSLGVLGLTGRVLTAAIGPQPYNIQFPGIGDDPGHRDVPYEAHIVTIPGLEADSVNGIREITYDFQSIYGFTVQGQPLFNAINEPQKQRAREVLELYARYLGVQFREISSTDPQAFADLTIATGDPRAVAPTISTNLPATGVRGIEGIPNVPPGAPLHPALGTIATSATGSITGATTTNPIAISSANHGLISGAVVRITGVTGNTAANGVWRIKRIDDNRFELNGSQGSADYISGGVWTMLDVTPRVAIMNALVNWGNSEYGGEYFRTAMHEIGSFLGLGTSFDLPGLTIMGGLETPTLATNVGEPVFPGDHDIVHGQALHRPESRDIDLYQFTVASAGLFRAETIAERMNDLATPNLLNTVLTLYREPGLPGQPRQIIARNDDYHGNDSYLELRLEPGNYYIAVTSTGNTEFDPVVENSGFGGRTQGAYNLKLEMKPEVGSSITDTTGVKLDGDADGRPGGKYEFWFQSNSAAGSTIYVDKANTSGPFLGTLADPLNNLAAAIDAAEAGPAKIIRVVGNGGTDGNVNTLQDNRAYLVGFKDVDLILDEPLADGADFLVPDNVTVMIDAGANFKLRKANLNAGTTPQSILPRGGGAIQVLGTPFSQVQFTSYHDDTIGGDSDGPQPGPQGGDWGGIVFRSDSDSGHRLDAEVQTLTLTGNGGRVTVSFNGIQGSAQTSFLNLNTTTAAAGAT